MIDSIKIQLSIIFEGTININDEEVNSYSLVWNDTIGESGNFSKRNRPFELKVVVRSQDTIVGKYTGLSSPMSHCTFLTNADFVTIHFWIGENMFYDWSMGKDDSSLVENKIMYNYIGNDYWDKISFNRKEYSPIRISTRSLESNNILNGYDNRTIILKPNPNIVCLYRINEGALNPNPMPNSNWGLATGLRQVIALDRYLVDTESGRIELGKKWIRKRGIAKTAEMHFRVIDPHLTYITKSGRQVPGKDLIRKKEVDTDSFETDLEFETLQWSLPYSIN